MKYIINLPRILLFIFGTIIGSFTGVLYSREGKESILFPSSHCDQCKKTLNWFELIPLVSFLFLKGHCRYCKSKIPKIYFIIEFINGLFYFLIGFRKYFIFINLTFSLFLILSLLDLKYMEVSVRLLLLFFSIRLLYMIWSGYFSFLFLIFVYFILFQNYIKEENIIGQGDLYILLSLSLDNLQNFLIYLLVTGLVSGAFAIYYLLKKQRKIAFIPILFVSFIITSIFNTQLLTYYFNY